MAKRKAQRKKEAPPNRAAKSEARRDAIVKAALAEFCARFEERPEIVDKAFSSSY